MKKLLTVALCAASLGWAIARRQPPPADTWAQATDPV